MLASIWFPQPATTSRAKQNGPPIIDACCAKLTALALVLWVDVRMFDHTSVVFSDTKMICLKRPEEDTPYVFPIIGGRKVEHLLGNIEALDIALTEEQITYLESVVDFDIGFPGNFIGTGTTQNWFMSLTAHFEKPLLLQTHPPAGKNQPPSSS